MSIQKAFDNHLVIVGFGAMGQALLPLLWKHIRLKPSQIIVVTDTTDGKNIAEQYELDFRVNGLTPDNYKSILKPLLKSGDMLLNMSVDVSSVDLIKLCHEQNSLYLDLSTEPWVGGYTDTDTPPSERTNYSFREACLALKGQTGPTAVITHGANPGLVSHFVRKALLNIAKDNHLTVQEPQTAQEWAALANTLGIKAIHIAERDSQITSRPYHFDEFSNTWSVDGFIGEALQPAELGWGTHERHFPRTGKHHEYGCKSAIYLDMPGAKVKVRTWTPGFGGFHGFLITHAESISISNFLTLHQDGKVLYRPTVHYAYLPCPHAILSLQQLVSNEGDYSKFKHHVLLDDITEGKEELGVLLMGNAKGAYWYGSILNIDEARELAPGNSATSLQVVAGALAAVLWAIDHPDRGIIEPEEIDYKYILDVASPYLGSLEGHYTTWTPLDNRGVLFNENIDNDDPWQFANIVVNQA